MEALSSSAAAPRLLYTVSLRGDGVCGGVCDEASDRVVCATVAPLSPLPLPLPLLLLLPPPPPPSLPPLSISFSPLPPHPLPLLLAALPLLPCAPTTWPPPPPLLP